MIFVNSEKNKIFIEGTAMSTTTHDLWLSLKETFSCIYLDGWYLQACTKFQLSLKRSQKPT